MAFDAPAAPTDAEVRFELRSGASWRDPYPMYAVLRDHDPLHHVADGDLWVLSRFDDVWRAARDTATFSSAHGLTVHDDELERIGLDGAARPLVMMDPPEHTAFRRLVAAGFTPRQVADLEPEVRRWIRDRLDRVADAAAATGEVDIVAELLKPLPSMVVGSYLGVPPEDRDRFDGWTEAIVEANAAGNVAAAGAALVELLGYFGELIDRLRAEPGDDALSHLVATGLGEDRATLVQVLGFAFTMVAGGNDTTTGLLGHAAEALTARPAQRAALLEDRALLPGAVEELLRLASPVQGLARTTTTDVDLHGHTIPAGRKVLLLYGSANRDPREFGPDADTLDVTRRIDRMMSFGYGAHFCLGAAVARMVGRVAVDELLDRFPAFEVDAGRGEFADGNYVRRYRSLPFAPQGFGT